MQIILTTVPSAEEAEILAKAIVEARLAACVQILPKMTSIYIWEGTVQKENERLMLIKTLPEKWEALREFITANHSYDVPEIVAIDGVHVFEPYREWLRKYLVGDDIW